MGVMRLGEIRRSLVHPGGEEEDKEIQVYKWRHRPSKSIVNIVNNQSSTSKVSEVMIKK